MRGWCIIPTTVIHPRTTAVDPVIELSNLRNLWAWNTGTT